MRPTWGCSWHKNPDRSNSLQRPRLLNVLGDGWHMQLERRFLVDLEGCWSWLSMGSNRRRTPFYTGSPLCLLTSQFSSVASIPEVNHYRDWCYHSTVLLAGRGQVEQSAGRLADTFSSSSFRKCFFLQHFLWCYWNHSWYTVIDSKAIYPKYKGKSNFTLLSWILEKNGSVI